MKILQQREKQIGFVPSDDSSNETRCLLVTKIMRPTVMCEMNLLLDKIVAQSEKRRNGREKQKILF